MLENTLFKIGKISRRIPNFRGKYRIGLEIQKLIIKTNACKNTKIWIRMKEGFHILIDIKSTMHCNAFWNGTYDSQLINKFSALFKKNWVVLDVGANVGYYTIPFALELKSKNGLVLAFEPSRKNFNDLKLSLEKTDCKNYQIHQMGLGDVSQRKMIYQTEKGESSNAVIMNQELLNKTKHYHSEEIQLVSLDGFIASNPIERCDFIKLDIEGYEIKFLNGAINTIKKFRPIIYGEFSNYYIHHLNQDMETVWSLCRSLGYNFYRLSDNRRSIQFNAIEKDLKYAENILLLPKELPPEESQKWVA